jgi:hypothetical protein
MINSSAAARMPATTEALADRRSPGLAEGGIPDVPDVILPEQFFGSLATSPSRVPERRLMLAVLLDAIAQLRRGPGPAREAEQWIHAGDEDADWPFSFVSVCHALGLDPGYMRGGLVRGRDRLATSTLLRQLRILHHRVTPKRRRRRRGARHARGLLLRGGTALRAG